MTLIFILLFHPGVGYIHCGAPMTWDTLRASYVCGSCGTTR